MTLLEMLITPKGWILMRLAALRLAHTSGLMKILESTDISPGAFRFPVHLAAAKLLSNNSEDIEQYLADAEKAMRNQVDDCAESGLADELGVSGMVNIFGDMGALVEMPTSIYARNALQLAISASQKNELFPSVITDLIYPNEGPNRHPARVRQTARSITNEITRQLSERLERGPVTVGDIVIKGWKTCGSKGAGRQPRRSLILEPVLN